LEAAEAQAREGLIASTLGEQHDIQTRAAAAAERLWTTLSEHEASLAELADCRLCLRRLNTRLSGLNYDGHSLQLGVKPQFGEYQRRIEKLVNQYGRVHHPLLLMPVRAEE